MACRNVPWIERYRPTSFAAIIGQEHAIRQLSSLVGHEMPSFLLTGPPGTGKTTAALAIAKMLHGTNANSTRVLHLDASSHRSIHVMRSVIHGFCRSAPLDASPWLSAPMPKTMYTAAAADGLGEADARSTRAPGGATPSRAKTPPKLVILDEVDGMGREALLALNRAMETHASAVRFILICNFPQKIPQPVRSRCVTLRFKLLAAEHTKSMLQRVSKSEGVVVDDETLSRISVASNGDARMSLQLLYQFHALCGKQRRLSDESDKQPEGEDVEKRLKDAFLASLLTLVSPTEFVSSVVEDEEKKGEDVSTVTAEKKAGSAAEQFVQACREHACPQQVFDAATMIVNQAVIPSHFLSRVAVYCQFIVTQRSGDCKKVEALQRVLAEISDTEASLLEGGSQLINYTRLGAALCRFFQ